MRCTTTVFTIVVLACGAALLAWALMIRMPGEAAAGETQALTPAQRKTAAHPADHEHRLATAAARGENIRAMFSLEMPGNSDATPGSPHYPFPFSWFYPDTADFIAFVGNLGLALTGVAEQLAHGDQAGLLLYGSHGEFEDATNSSWLENNYEISGIVRLPVHVR